MSYNTQEKQYFDQLFNTVDKNNAGVLPGQDVFDFLLTSKLPQQTLGEIWAVSDPDNNGFLTKDGWYKAARLIGWMQKGGVSVDDSLASGPLPTFAGQPAPPQPLTAQTTGKSSLPSITSADRTKFTRIFVGCSPQNGLVTGDKARDVFIKSQLGYDQLGQIWNLADTQSRGSLDLPDFIIGMFLIQSCMANPALTLPSSLPGGLYEQASGGRVPPTSPISRQNTGPASPLRTQYTGNIQPQTTGQSSLGRPAAWDVTPEAKAASDRFFTTLDTGNKGVIEGDVAVPFMLQSQLDEASLATIWDLADIRQEGKLTRDEFAVAMYLINAKLAGTNVPTTLPDSLIPPSLRAEYGGKEILSNTNKDLFDLFDDPTPPPPTTRFLPQPPARRSTNPTPAPPPRAFLARSPPSDLLGDDSAPAPDVSADLGNKQNELTNTTRNLSQLEQTRKQLESSAASSASQIAELDQKLSDAKARHETESKAVTDLRTRVSEQASRQKTLESEVIAAESDLSAMKSEKTELEQALMRDKEEVRGLQKMMKEMDEERATLKVTLEKLKKDTRQQKGMVTIAKKQLSTAEGSRDQVQGEIDNVSSSMFAEPSPPPAASIPLPVTPKALSPVPTGISQRSNNPFERLRGLQAETKPKPEVEAPKTEAPSSFNAGILGAVGAVTGLVVGGAETVYHAAKEVVVPEHEVTVKPSEAIEASALVRSPGPAASTPKASPPATDADPFGAPGDPFGAPGNSQSGFDGGFDDGFGDSFAKSAGDSEQPQLSGPTTNFDDSFDDAFVVPATHARPVDAFDERFTAPGPTESAGSAAQPLTETAKTELDRATSPEDFDSAFIDFDPSTSQTKIPAGIPASALPAHVRPEVERSTSTQAVAPVSRTASPIQPDESRKDEASSDEEEGPEDLEVPVTKGKERAAEYRSMSPVDATQPISDNAYNTDFDNLPRSDAPAEFSQHTAPAIAPPILAPPTEFEPKSRRSAPPPPARSTDDFDPFGASITSLPPGAAPASQSAPKNANFDEEDDFDFSDLPPAHVEAQPATAASKSSAFDDEFAGFDDDFDKPTGSDNSGASKSYEMVSPPPHAGAFGAGPAPSSGFSFDDAFGGNSYTAPTQSGPAQYAPPIGAPPSQQASSLKPPALPERRESQPQTDDLEDVKKLCAMGFSRSLVIEALDANDYNFQKALNVLLVQ